MKRRRFIGATGATIALSTAAWFALRDPGCTADLPPLLQLTFDECWRIREIGEAYRQANPDEDNVSVLRSLISQAGDDSALTTTIQQEFATDKTVEVLGWILSETEARHCALYSLLAT